MKDASYLSGSSGDGTIAFIPVKQADRIRTGAKALFREGTPLPDQEVIMGLMPIIMVSPLWGLLLFYSLPVGHALFYYLVLLMIAAYFHYIMMWSMHAKPRTGLDAMIGEKASVIRDIDPEGKVELHGELWTAISANGKIPAGETVKIVAARRLILTVSRLDGQDAAGQGVRP